MFILESQDDYLRITEDNYYILSCLEDLPLATYSDGKRLHNTEAYQERRGKRFEVGYKNYDYTEYKQYATTEDKMAVLTREQQNFTVWEEDDES